MRMSGTLPSLAVDPAASLTDRALPARGGGAPRTAAAAETSPHTGSAKVVARSGSVAG